MTRPADGEQPAGLPASPHKRWARVADLYVGERPPNTEHYKWVEVPAVGPVPGGLTQQQARRIEDVLEELDVDRRSWSKVETDALADLHRLAEGATE